MTSRENCNPRGAAQAPTTHAVPRTRPGQAGGARDRNRKERTVALMTAALDVFLEVGLHAARIEDITSRAGMSKGIFYRYFRDKEHLVLHLLSPTVHRILPAFRRSAALIQAARTPFDLVAAYAPLVDAVRDETSRSPRTLALYLAERRAAGVGARRPIVELSRWIQAGAMHLTSLSKEGGWLRDNEFVGQLSTIAVVGAVEELLFRGLQGDIDSTPTQVVQQLAAMVYGGILRSGPGPRSTA